MLEDIKFRIAVTNWSALPAPLWVLIASPLLHWAGIGEHWFSWPHGCSSSPFSSSFWRVSKGA